MSEQIAFSSLLGAPVYDSSGAMAGRVREMAMSPRHDPAHVSDIIVKASGGDRLLSAHGARIAESGAISAPGKVDEWPPLVSSEGLLLLERDLLDQQIIDVSGRKVVRVNDLGLFLEKTEDRIDHQAGERSYSNGCSFKIRVGRVDIGLRGAVRRLLKGLVPRKALEAFTAGMPERSIPGEAVDLIETDPSRRVHLKLEYERLSKLHPADIADILEELAPAAREAVFESLDDEVAAEALEEIDPKLQVELMRSIDSDKAADIVEEMDPDAAADLLGDLPEETSEEILEEMEPEEREEVTELLAFEENTAAGRMTTEYLSVPPEATVADAIEKLRAFEGAPESIGTIFLVDSDDILAGAVPLIALVLSPPNSQLSTLARDPLIFCESGASEKEVTEIFDKYNLNTLPVVDEQKRLTGVVTADDVISILRAKVT